ncbi:MAG: nitroreductase family protein [Candidatus Pacebacteria bacterium]|nr:nitroreductase family protein [Candidatus Paceibacterota bacterium]
MDEAEKEKIRAILTAAAAAPSGSNSQPWRFVVRGRTIEFHYLPERDHPILNYEESGTLIALGAAIQNAELEARAQGYTPQITYRESGSCVAVMELEVGGRIDDASQSLREAILKRHSNRKAYKDIALSPESKSALVDSAISGDSALAFSLIEDREVMQVIARALTTMEETALGNKTLHEFFFSEILWSADENRAGKQGLYIKTLELPPPAQAMFRLLKHWGFARVLAKIGFPKMVAQTNAKQNASASAFGVITVGKTSRTAYLEVGKIMERIWLSATAHELSMQIVTGVTFLARSLQSSEITTLFNLQERERIAAAHAIIKKSVDDTREPILIFRIGTGNSPTEVSYRRPPEILFN